MRKKVLIIGNSAKEYALAKKISGLHDVYVAPGSDTIKEFATVLDIREDAVAELLEFAMENGIDITIPTSKKTLNTNIVEVFNKKGFSFPMKKNEKERIEIRCNLPNSLKACALV